MKKAFGMVLCLAIGLAIGLLFNPLAITDFLRMPKESLSGEIAEIGKALELTGTGEGLYKVSRPTLDDRNVFNESCKSHDSEVTILGCYSERKIHIYNIETDELSGIIPSTAAHELLHAAWERLPFLEQYFLSQEIEKFYNENYTKLVADLEGYKEEDRLDELHSRIGTEFKELPEALEKHYAKYFSDQDLIVDYYEQYSGKFLELRDEIKELDAEIDELKPTIDEMREKYRSWNEDLNRRIDEFNACAKKEKCFSEEEFNRKRVELLEEQAEVEEYYNRLNETIEEYNALIDEYNGNVLRSRTLENAINSNSEEEEMKINGETEAAET